MVNIPNPASWFSLDRYANSENFTVVDWAEEIENRALYYETLFGEGSCHPANSRVDFVRDALGFFENIKRFGLCANFPTSQANDVRDRTEELHNKYGYFRGESESVRSLSIWTAYTLTYDDPKKKHITRQMRRQETLDYIKDEEERAKIWSELTHPYVDETWELNDRYLEVDLEASDQQLEADFRTWLKAERAKGLVFRTKSYVNAHAGRPCE